MMISLLDMTENTVGKGENAGYQHFLLFPQCFSKPSYIRVAKSGDRVVRSWLTYENISEDDIVIVSSVEALITGRKK